MNGDRMFGLAQALAVAKSRQDVPAAMRLLHRDMVLETPAFGTRVRGTAENEKVLTLFFRAFPDYDVELEGHASNADSLVCWGTVRMTMTGDRFGVVPNGRRAELPVFIRFTFKDGLIAGERFFFDLATLCAQSGVSTDAVRKLLFGDAATGRSGDLRHARQADRRDRDGAPVRHRHRPGSSAGHRRAVRAAGPVRQRGGTFEGPDLRGDVLPGGGDWAVFRPDGSMTLDVRLTLRTHDGALVQMTYGGRWIVPPELRADIADPQKRHRIDPARYYFRTNPLFETGTEQYAWLNGIVCAARDTWSKAASPTRSPGSSDGPSAVAQRQRRPHEGMRVPGARVAAGGPPAVGDRDGGDVGTAAAFAVRGVVAGRPRGRLLQDLAEQQAGRRVQLQPQDERSAAPGGRPATKSCSSGASRSVRLAAAGPGSHTCRAFWTIERTWPAAARPLGSCHRPVCGTGRDAPGPGRIVMCFLRSRTCSGPADPRPAAPGGTQSSPHRIGAPRARAHATGTARITRRTAGQVFLDDTPCRRRPPERFRRGSPTGAGAPAAGERAPVILASSPSPGRTSVARG